MNLTELYATQNRNIIKSDFLNLLGTYLSFTYERSIKPGRSFELTLGFIGMGVNMANSDAEGQR